jgi:hypothetical protein
MKILHNTLYGLTLGFPQHFENLTVFPLIGTPDGEPSYDTLDMALGEGRLRVTETSDAGSVPEIKVRNAGDRAVLIIDGEELVGAKQNRTVNLTILVPQHSDVIVPVTCVEAGRWRARSAEFSSVARTHFAEGRAAKSRQVTESLRSLGVPTADQGQVWSAIADKAARLQAHSATGAMAQMFEAHAASVEEYVKAIQVTEGECGAVFVIDGVPRGLDIFDNSRTFRAMLPKLLRGYAIDAYDHKVASKGAATALAIEGETHREDIESAVREFFSTLQNVDSNVFPAVGQGEAWRIVSPNLSGGALVVDGRVVHASVFRS